MASKENLTEADIDAMKSGKVYKLLGEFGVDVEDFNDLKEAKTALKEKIQELQRGAENATSTEQAAEIMASVTESYRARRELLLRRCRDVIAYLPNLDQTDREKLESHFKRDVMEILEEIQEHLSKDDCPILVAGETSAGKSTLLNLLLGDDILPVAHLSSTSTICELKYGETRQAVVHLREADPVTGSTQITLSLSTNREECRQQLEPYIHLRTTERNTLPKANKIEIFWPLVFLKGGVTIVDSPGVGESDMMDEVVASYIPSAFAFIYIIDSSSAGGEHKNRLLGKLLAKCKDLEQFDPTKAMFVLNKWDLVPTEERQEVKEETIRKLGEMWEGLDESQVFVHSNKEAVKGGFRSADFNKLLDGIYDLLPQTLNHKLSTQYRQMTSILKEALLYVRLKLNDAYSNLDEDERRRVYVRAQTALSRFDESTAGILKELRDYLEDATETAKTVLATFLQGGELKERLVHEDLLWTDMRDETDDDSVESVCSWIANDVMFHPSSMNHISQVKEVFEVKLEEMVTRVKHEYSENIRPVTGRRCHLKVENSLSRDRFWRIIRLAVVRMALLYGWLLPYGRVLLPYGPNQVHERSTILSKSSHEHEHSDRSRLYDLAIAAVTKDEILTAVVGNILTKSFDLLTDFESDLKAIKDVDRLLVEERFAETRSQMELVSTYEPQASGITLHLGRLAMVHLWELREYEFDLDGIVGWPDPQNRIAGGSYGEVYKVQVQRDGVLVRAALKVGVYPYDITTEENAWDFLTEEDNLRKLMGDHIVEFYGTACKRVKGGLKLGLVMELCEGTLESRIIGQKEHNPARWGHDPTRKQRAFSYIQDKAIQLCEGLRTIHDAGYIHRDLKLSNVLVTAGDVVKLAEVGVTKREVDVTGTITGTATYAAPEVKDRKKYDKSADIYSLGLILWEMWYGKTLYGLEDENYSNEFEEDLKEGRDIKMPRWEGTVPPIPEWTSLIHNCLKKDPRERPKIQKCLDRISAMKLTNSEQMLDTILSRLDETGVRLLMRVWSARTGKQESPEAEVPADLIKDMMKNGYVTTGDLGIIQKDMMAAGISFPAIVQDSPDVPEELKCTRTTAAAAVGPTGGEVEIPGFVKLSVPAGILEHDTTITISTVDAPAILRDPESANWTSGYPWSLGEDACPRELLDQVLFSPAFDVNLHGAQLNGPVEVQTWRPPGSEGMECLLLKYHDEEGWTDVTASTRHHIDSDRLSMLLQNFSITAALWVPVDMVKAVGKTVLAAFSSGTVDCSFAAYSNPGADELEFHVVCRDRCVDTDEYLQGFKWCGSNDATSHLFNGDVIKVDVSLCGCQQTTEVTLRAMLCKQNGQAIQMVLRRPNRYPAIGKVHVMKSRQSVCGLTFRQEDDTFTGAESQPRDDGAEASGIDMDSGATGVAWCIPIVVEMKPPWRELGGNLGLSEADAERISEKHQDDTERCCLAVLLQWLHLSGTNATVEVLKNALNFAGQKEIVEKLNTMEQQKKRELLELQRQVTDIVHANFPSLNFVPDKNKVADERRRELNRRTLRGEEFSHSHNFSLDSVVLDRIQERKQSVCRINWPGGCGTGFLLSKGKVLTCYHVYRMMNRAVWSVHEASQYTATFCVSVGRELKVPFETPAALLKCYDEDLDYAILQLAVDNEMERNLASLPLLGHYISESEDSRKMVVIVGHPSGGNKVVDFGCIAGVVRRYIIHIRFPNLIQEDERELLYDTSVMFHGSSGSPGFDTYGNLVLMHTRGFPDASSKSLIERGVRLSAIREHARQNLAPDVFNEIFPASSEQVAVSMAALSIR